jgi:ubiquinone biosynthesis protein
MERVTGGKVTDAVSSPGHDKDRLAQLLAEALVAWPFFSCSDQAPFHGDPHAGNLFLTTDGRLAILDWSLTGSLGERERVALVQIVLAALALDSERVVSLLEGLAQQQADRPALVGVVRSWLRRITRGSFPTFTWLLGLLDEAVLQARLRLDGDLLLLRKTLHTLEGVIADVGGSIRAIDWVLLENFLRHWAAEWPRRWFTPPASRAFATRLSNADLVGFFLQFPVAATRYWMEFSRPRLAT